MFSTFVYDTFRNTVFKKIMEDKNIDKVDCFKPERNNPYSFCIGRGFPECEDCQLRAEKIN